MRIGIIVFMVGVIMFQLGTFFTNKDQESRLKSLEAASHSAQQPKGRDYSKADSIIYLDGYTAALIWCRDSSNK